MRKPIPFAIVVLLGIGFDLLTKYCAFHALGRGQAYVLIPNVFAFVHAENHGVAFSMFADYPWLILAVTSAAIAGLIGWFAWIREKGHPLALVATALLLIGATGNLMDRLTFNFVRDFIDFVPPIPWIGHWAVFNVADICITAGVILYVIVELFLTTEKKSPASPAPNA